MSLAKSPVTGSPINLIPCTSGEDRLCHIFREVSLWNEYFWEVNLELTELSPGHLSLKERINAYVGWYTDNQVTSEQMHVIATLLQHLLTRHQCFTSVMIVTPVFREHHQLICEALCKSQSLEKLTLYEVWTAEQSLCNIAGALLHLNHLRELELQDMPINRDFIDGLSEFLASTRSLTVLTVTHPNFKCEEDAVAFLEGLRRNQTITTLSLDMMRLWMDPFNSSIDIMVPPRYAALLSDYLCVNRTVRALSIGGHPLENSTGVVRHIVPALALNNTLRKLSFTSLTLEDKDVELISWLLSQNRTLTSFNMIRCDTSIVSGRACCSLAALINNKTLEELTLDLSKLNTKECHYLFKGLASNPHLKKVTVELYKQADVADICRAARETSAQERFFFGTHYVLENTAAALTECKELSSIAIEPELFRRYEPVIATLSLLPSCSHVTSLLLELTSHQFQGRVSSLIAQCITGMTSLKTLKLCIQCTGTVNAFNKGRQELAQALSVNKTIRRLRIYGPCFGETETAMLADTLQSSETLCELSYRPHIRESVISLIQKLSPNISSNYTLLDMDLAWCWSRGGDWFAVADVIRRNCVLVMRAAHFVFGTKLKYCAAAAELVHSNPVLVERVQELASVDEDEAVSRIKKSLKSFSELDDFMRLAGVVKYGVTSHRRDGGQKQLVDIGRDCWLYLRQYIKVGDILDEQ